MSWASAGDIAASGDGIHVGPPSASASPHEAGAPQPAKSPYLQVFPWVLAAAMVAATVVGLRIIHAGVHAPPRPRANATQPAATTTTLPKSGAARQFLQFAASLQAANAAALQALTEAGTSPSVPQVTAIADSYDQSVEVYYFQLHFIAFPVADEADVHNEYVQLQALQAVLKGVVFLTPSRMGDYLALLRSSCTTVERADNSVRTDLHLPSTNTFP